MKQKFLVALVMISSFFLVSCIGQKKIDITYVANSGFLIESEGQKILIDALFKQGWDTYLTPTDSILSDIVTQQDPFQKANLLLVTHNHGDHIDFPMVANYLINNSENILIAPPSVADVFFNHPEYKTFENQIISLDKNNRAENDTIIQGIRVRSFFLQHDTRPNIENVGYLIEFDNHKVFHTGDFNGAEVVEFEKLQLQNENIDLALLNFYGFWKTKEDREFAEKYINPKNIILMHIPPAEIETVIDSVDQINDFIDITVFEDSMNKKSFIFEKQ